MRRMSSKLAHFLEKTRLRWPMENRSRARACGVRARAAHRQRCGYTKGYLLIGEAEVTHHHSMLTLMRNLSLALLALGAFVLTAHADVGDAAKLKTVLLDGKPVALDQYKGKVVMVNFWTT